MAPGRTYFVLRLLCCLQTMKASPAMDSMFAGKFRRIGLQGVEGCGFSFCSISRDQYEYREGDRRAIIVNDFGYDEAKPKWTTWMPFGLEIWCARHMYTVVFISK